ncbi:hypothetical protein AVEN_112059-1, partial [Araneus ventricosus]
AVAKRHFDFKCFESEDSIHSFEFPYADTDNNLDPEHFDNEECIICNEQEKMNWDSSVLYASSGPIPPVLAEQNPSPWRCNFVIDFIS